MFPVRASIYGDVSSSLPRTANAAMSFARLRRPLLISIGFGAVVFAALVAYGDVTDVAEDIEDFHWPLLPLVLLVALGNYVLRWVKWQYYLGRLRIDVPPLASFLIFMSGLALVVTPAKVGEWVKCYLLKQRYDVPLMRSTPILFAERVTDALALMLLALAGAVAFERSVWPVIAVVVLGAAIVMAISRHRPFGRAALARVQRLPIVGRFAPTLNEMYESNYALMAPRDVALMTALSVVAWGTQVVAFYLVLVGLQADAGGETFMKASFILPISTLAAALLLLPGGLGVAETGIASLTESLLDVSRSVASAATLLIRLSTLWFAVVLGLVAYFIVLRLSAMPAADPEGAERGLATATDSTA
jgi:uncharacterized protein (TIRG00374 family)